jgi:hypothetical protein
MQDSDRLEVELVGAQVGVGHAEVVQDTGEPSDARPRRPAEAHPDGVGELRSQVLGRLAEERERAVEERWMLDAIVGERLESAAEPLSGFARLLVDGLEQRVDFGEVARGREREQLFLGGEVSVDEGLVDADPAGDAVDTRVLGSALVEQGSGRVEDLTLARASAPTSASPCAWPPFLAASCSSR